MKQKISNFLIFLIYIFLSGCERNQLSQKEKIVYHINNEISALFSEKYGLKLMSIGLGNTRSSDSPTSDRKINELSISFTLNKILRKKDARKLLIECVNDYLYVINNNREIKKYLVEFPFLYKYLSVTIFFFDNDIRPVYPDICCIFLVRSKVFYRTDNPENPRGPFFTEEEETLDEALRIINET